VELTTSSSVEDVTTIVVQDTTAAQNIVVVEQDLTATTEAVDDTTTTAYADHDTATTTKVIHDTTATAEDVYDTTITANDVHDTTTMGGTAIGTISVTQAEDISAVDSDEHTTINEQSTAASKEASNIYDDDYEEIRDDYSDEDYTISHDTTTLHKSGDDESESTHLKKIETSSLSSPTSQQKIYPTTPQIPVDKYGRPKNRPSVHRFPTSGATVLSVTLCTTSNIIKSIGLIFIQLKMISNSFSGCYNLT